MKSLMLLFQTVLEEFGNRCCTSTSADLKTVSTRSRDEGLSFLTITLPNFGTDFQKSLAQGKVDRNLFQGFSWKGGLPKLFSGFLGLVFDRETGVLIDDPNIDAIFAIRQLTLMFGKIKIACSDTRRLKAIKGFVDCDKEVRESERRWAHLQDEFNSVSDLLWRNVFTAIDRKIYYGELIPKHGSGAVAEKLSSNQKYNQTEWTNRLESVFPARDNLLSSYSDFESLDRLTYLEPGAERPVRVVDVPKTLKTPRIIAIEPTCMQYMQQAMLEAFCEEFREDDISRNFIEFSSQEPNQLLAKEGSRSGNLATLDLSEASDRVSNQLVRGMVRRFPSLAEGLDATRSRKADVPGHSILRLAKFASMGSALCFPIESMVFCTIVFLGIQDELSHPLTRKEILSFVGKVRIYGDDIIVPVEYVRSVVSRLETFGFKVNAGKSFWTGKFRESCGKDYYDGHDVSVTRVRHLFPTQQSNAQEIISLFSLRNQFYKAGLWATVKYLDNVLAEMRIPAPAIWETSPMLGRVTYLPYQVDSWHVDLHAPLVKGYRVIARPPSDKLDGYGALLKFFLKRGTMPSADRNHLERYGRPDAVNIKRGKGSPF